MSTLYCQQDTDKDENERKEHLDKPPVSQRDIMKDRHIIKEHSNP